MWPAQLGSEREPWDNEGKSVLPHTTGNKVRCVFTDSSARVWEAIAPQGHSYWELRGLRESQVWALKGAPALLSHAANAAENVAENTDANAAK